MRNIVSILSLISIFIFGVLQSQICPTLKDDFGNENTSIMSCATLSTNTCLNLTANFPDLRDTSSYGVASIAYTPRGTYNTGTPVRVYEDDSYVKRINFADAAIFGNKPFNFSFFGNFYPSLLISSNGFITFNQLYQEGDYSTGELFGHPIPDEYLPSLSVFGVFQDLDFSQQNGSEIYYKVEGTAPCRILTINFYKGRIAGTNQFSTSQIVLHELGGKIEVFVENKPLPDASARFDDAVIGLTDASSDGVAAPERNTGIWSAQNEGWLFEPNGKIMRPTYSWYKDEELLTGIAFRNKKLVSVCPKNPLETYRVEASYQLDSGESITYSKEIILKADSNYPFPKNYTKYFCNGDTSVVYQRDFYSNVTTNPVSNFNFKFYSTSSNAEAGGPPEFNPSVPLNKGLLYYVRIENKTNPGCFRIAVLKLSDQTSVLRTNRVDICDANNDGIEENYVLNKLLCQLFDENFMYSSPKFYLEGSNTSVTRTNLTTATRFYIEITTECGTTKYGPISVNFTSGPAVNTFTKPIDISICDVVTSGNPPKREPNFDWEKYFKENNIIISPDPNIFQMRVFLTKAGAVSGRGAISYINEGLPNIDPLKDYIYSIFVRVEYEEIDPCLGVCYSIVELPVRVKFNKIILNVSDADADKKPDDPLIYDTEDADIYLCKGSSKNIDLEADSKKTILVTNPVDGSGIFKTFHNSYKEADDLADNIGISKNQTLPATGLIKTYYVRYRLGNTVEDSCYVVKRINYRIVNFTIKDKISICSEDVTKPLKIDLSSYNQTILGALWNQNPKPTLKYYTDASASAEITELSITSDPKTIYVKVTSGYNPACFEILPVTFTPIQAPKLLNSVINVNITCDNNGDGKEFADLTSYINQLVDPTLASYNINFYRNYNATRNVFSGLIPYNDAKNIEVQNGLTIYVKLQAINSNCISKAEIKFNVNFIDNNIVKLNDNATLVQCNISGQVSNFDLNDVIYKMYGTENPPFSDFIENVTFYESELDANRAQNAISNVNVYSLNKTQPRKILWARFQSKSGCYSAKPFVLRIIESINFSGTSPLLPLCDDNLDGTYSYNLRNWVNEQIKNSTVTSSFLTDYDATLGANYSFYNESTDTNPLTSDEEMNFHPIPGTKTYVWIKADGNGCSTMMRLDFDFGDLTVFSFSHPPICVGESINLKVFENQQQLQPAINFEYYRTESDLINGINKITNPSQYEYENISEIFVKIIKPVGSCPRKAVINLSLKTTPVFTMIPEYYFCETSGKPIEVFANVSKIYTAGLKPKTYIWTLPDGTKVTNQYPDSTYDVTRIGKYSLTIVADNGCSNTVDFEVKPIDVPEIYKLVVEGNKVIVLATSKNPNRRLVYSYEGFGKWQSNYIFYDVPLGPRTFYVKYEDEQGDCAAKPMQTIVVDVINTITPNGDGINDVWKLGNLEFFEGKNTTLKIFDRYNKLVFEKEGNTEIVWDGYYGDRVLPTATYWYVALFPDGRQLNGWILLKNRD